ncbi:2-dehydro-3-deoxygalactonokinase [Aureimonas sp. ME7]|uniref:2-dehydro-3-deoxygalactonokinase n=1 Tax=Aureimonas sp. ME7 TaxID=2744252 RepID=UPI0015F3A03C|nr:2-dehydro-3-deoxygalactonokinase [Aureimonas sp. ME7]
MTEIAYALVDWGTSSFRAWACAADGHVLGERRSGDGLLNVADGGFATVLEGHLEALGVPADAPAILCGMVGSRTGWVEAPYLSVPTDLAEVARRSQLVPHARRPIHILPGLSQRGAAPDVMRGEETQLLGIVAEGFATGTVCMPGTHSKWVKLHEGRVIAFSSFMTGELFQLLRTSSILKAAVETETGVDPKNPAFADGFGIGFSDARVVTNALFQLRAGWLLDGLDASDQAARLSGLLIGLEFAGAGERLGRDGRHALLASGPIAGLYQAAFDLSELSVDRTFDADGCVRHGLRAAALLLHPERTES